MTFSREQMLGIIREPQTKGNSVGIGLYRNGYRRFGAEFWGFAVSSEVQHFLNETLDPQVLPNLKVLDVGAGTGKNILEFVRLGAKHAVAVEVDSLAGLSFLRAVVALEEAGVLEENRITIVKQDAVQFLEYHHDSYDVVIAYGLLHVFKDNGALQRLIRLIQKVVRKNGYLIIQAITSKYPAPASQPELDGIIVDEDGLRLSFPSTNWSWLHVDNRDILHSHEGSNDDHRHGSLRAILQKI